ncbi:MAG TPA: glycosyltransferase family 4 protein [Devosiaceae bacterium]|jgi:glycosyltransferase involved in cell wall biosynthesis
MTIIFANRYFHPDQSATSRMVSSLALALARAGEDVAVLTSRELHDGSRKDLPAEEVIEGVRVYRLGTTHFGRRHLPGRLADYLSYHAAAAAWLLRSAQRDDICVMCTDPPMLSVTAALPLRLKGARLVNWIMDLFPEVAIDLGLVKAGGAPARLALALRDWSLRQAAVNSCPIGTMARYLEERGIAPAQLTIEHHWSEANEIYPVKRGYNRLRRAWHYGDELVVGYSGNFGRAHDFSTVLEAAERLRDRQDIRFLFIGDGQQRATVEAQVAHRALGSIKFKPLQPRERLAESLGVADVHLVSLLPALERSIIPSKLYGILAAGRPTLFVGDTAGEVAGVIAEGRCGLAVNIGEGERLAAMISDLADYPDIVANMGANAKALFDAHYTREQGVAAWQALLDGLMAKPETAPVQQGAGG